MLNVVILVIVFSALIGILVGIISFGYCVSNIKFYIKLTEQDIEYVTKGKMISKISSSGINCIAFNILTDIWKV